MLAARVNYHHINLPLVLLLKEVYQQASLPIIKMSRVSVRSMAPSADHTKDSDPI